MCVFWRQRKGAGSCLFVCHTLHSTPPHHTTPPPDIILHHTTRHWHTPHTATLHHHYTITSVSHHASTPLHTTTLHHHYITPPHYTTPHRHLRQREKKCRPVIQKADLISAFNSGASHFVFWSVDPYRWSTSMLPVSEKKHRFYSSPFFHSLVHLFPPSRFLLFPFFHFPYFSFFPPFQQFPVSHHTFSKLTNQTFKTQS